MKQEIKNSIRKPYKIFSESIDQKALDQFFEAMEDDRIIKGALMPDAHLGYSLPIGGVVACKDSVFPSFVGYDIGCGVLAYKTDKMVSDIKGREDDIFSGILKRVPVGIGGKHGRDSRLEFGNDELTEFANDVLIKKEYLRQLGTLGAGNHFIEISHDESDSVWIVIHSGSRGMGHAIASHYMLKAAGLYVEYQENPSKIHFLLNKCEGNFALSDKSEYGLDYIKDMNFCLKFALLNRKIMLIQVLISLRETVLNEREIINRNHNHADFDGTYWIHRKGATHAKKGMKGVIPGNMRDGSFIVTGKGNSDSINSSSHGAGRVLSRNKARESISLERFKDQMKGIKSFADEKRIDESPSAYKNIFEVMEMQKNLVTIDHHLKPLLNIKG